jgi:hypothetical protein
MLTAIVVPADPGQPVAMEHIAKDDLTAYRRLVGGHLEVIHLERPPASLYLNEEGKVLELPLNPRATALLWMHNASFRGWDLIVGNAFILGPPDDESYDTTAPAELVELLFKTERYRVQFQVGISPAWYTDDEIFDDWYEAYVHGLRLVHQRGAVSDVQVVPERPGPAPLAVSIG